MDLKAIKQDIADLAMGATTGQYKITASAFWPGSPTLPCLAPGEQEGDYHADMDESVDLTLTWRLAVARQEEESAQALLDTYLSTGGDNSIVDAIESDSRFTVTGFSGYSIFEWAGTPLYGVELTIEVLL